MRSSMFHSLDPLTIPGVVESAARRFGGAEALVDGELRLSFEELAQRIDLAARAFVGSSIQPGDRVAVWAPNMAEWIFAALGAHRAGAVVVPLNTRFKGYEAAYILDKSGARMLFTVTDFLDTDYVELLGNADVPPTLEEVVLLRGRDRDGTTPWDTFVSRADAVAPSAGADRAGAIAPDDLSDILFTSGTTGAPKGAMLRH